MARSMPPLARPLQPAFAGACLPRGESQDWFSMSRKPSRRYQLTIRLEGEVAESVRRMAKEESISLNQAVVRMLERGARLDRRPGSRIGNRLERFYGLISRDEAREISDAADAAFGQIDPKFWK